HLVASFHATLEETRTADLLLLVVDISDAGAPGQMEAVRRVLGDIGAADKPTLVVFNKADLPHNALELHAIRERFPRHVVLSARTGEGVAELEAQVTGLFDEELVEVELDVPHDSGAVEAAVARSGKVVSTEYGEKGVRLRALIRRSDVSAIRRLAGG
ncbi:MAG: HflX GTPase family protein, partial [Planctomycetota bacterium]